MYSSDVVTNPFVEDGDQKIAVSFGLDALSRHGTGRVRLALPVTRQLRGNCMGQAEANFLWTRRSLHDGIELYVPHAAFFQKAIDLERVFSHVAGDRHQHVELDSVALHAREATHDIVEARAALLVGPVQIVHLARPIQAQPYQEA